MKRAIVLVLLAGGIAACATLDYHRRYYDGPASDHFDGTHFFSPSGAIGKGALDVIEWRLKGERAEWPDAVPLPATAKPAERVHGNELKVTFVGHATVLVQVAGLNILTDPHWSERAFVVDWAGPKRVTPPGIAFEDLPLEPLRVHPEEYHYGPEALELAARATHDLLRARADPRLTRNAALRTER